MRIPRIYIKQQLTPHSHLELNAETSHYINKVLRMEVGRNLIVLTAMAVNIVHPLSRLQKKQHRLTLVNSSQPIENHH